MANLDSILKSRDITLPTEVHLFKAMKTMETVTDYFGGLQNHCGW